ncbi:MAG TPA: phospholipase A2 [Propionibacteriaceae bacterium]|nr:phospholipase A2 [Propionibacteriaceae bacterium]
MASAAQQLIDDPTDSCNFVPDTFGEAVFTDACKHHDECYRDPMGRSRLACDLTFLGELRAACDVYGMQTAPQLTCLTFAGIYFVGVRLFGAPFYNDGSMPPSPAA